MGAHVELMLVRGNDAVDLDGMDGGKVCWRSGIEGKTQQIYQEK